MTYAPRDLSALNRNLHRALGRIISEAFDYDGGGGMNNDLIMYGAEGTTSFLRWDYSEDKAFLQRTTTDTAPGRLFYIQHLGSAMAVGENIQGIQIRARATGTGTIAGGTDGAEIKSGLNSDSDTGTIAQARGVIGNVDAKKGTITTAHLFEGQVDVGSGGTITTLKGFRASMNNSGTITTSYAFIVETANVSYNWTYGLYMASGQADYPIDVTQSVTWATGNSQALNITVANTGARTAGIVKGASINVNPLAATDIHQVYGAEVCVYMASDVVTSTGVSCGLFVELQGGGTIGGDLYGLYVYYAPAASPSGSDAVVRLESNVTADDRCGSFIAHVGGKAEFVWVFGPLGTQTAWSYTGTPSNQVGWLKVKVGSATRYIRLHDTL